MKHRILYSVLALTVLFSMALTACTPAATPTAAPAPAQPTQPAAPAQPEPTKPPEPTAPPAPTAVPPAAAFETMKREAPDCNYGGNLKSIETTDAATIKFTLCNPDAAFLAKIAVPAFKVFPKAYLEKIGGDAAKLADNPVGTGPYIIKEWIRGDHITFEVNPNYWGTPAKNKTFILKWNKEAAARLLDLQSGNIDGIDNVGTDDYATVKGDANLGLYPRVFNNFLYMGFQNETPPFDNEAVRQAFAMAIDKAALVKDFYPDGARPADQFLPPGVKPGYTDGYTSPKFDPVKAKQMLTEAKFDFSKEYTLSYAERTRPYFPQPTKIAQAVQAQLGEIGVKIKLELMEWAAYLPAVRAGQKPLHFLGWSEDFPDATNWYDVFLRGSNKQFGKPFPDIVNLIDIGARSADVKVRQDAYDKLNKLIDQHVPAVTLANGATSLSFKKEVKNVLIGPYNENFQEMESPSGQIVFSQDGDPVSLMCPDETDGSSFRACDLIFDNLYKFKFGSAQLEPALAEKCEGNADATVWTCTMRQNVKFSDGEVLNANDAFASFTMGWDYKDPNRKGNTGVFQYFKDFFGPKALNEPPQ